MEDVRYILKDVQGAVVTMRIRTGEMLLLLSQGQFSPNNTEHQYMLFVIFPITRFACTQTIKAKIKSI